MDQDTLHPSRSIGKFRPHTEQLALHQELPLLDLRYRASHSLTIGKRHGRISLRNRTHAIDAQHAQERAFEE